MRHQRTVVRVGGLCEGEQSLSGMGTVLPKKKKIYAATSLKGGAQQNKEELEKIAEGGGLFEEATRVACVREGHRRREKEARSVNGGKTR